MAAIPVSTDRGTIPLSLIVPVYGRPAELSRALDSVAGQDIRPAQVIVVDDASPVPVVIEPHIVERLDVTLIRHSRNVGPAAARNSGLRESRFRWVSFLDSDDYFRDRTLGQRWDYLEKDQARNGGSSQIVYGCAWMDALPDGTALRVRTPRPSGDPIEFASGCWFSPGSCVIVDGKAAVAAAGGLDENLRRFEDLDWFLRLALAGFRLEIMPIVGVNVQRQRVSRIQLVADSRRHIEGKWASQSEARLLRHLRAYLDLESAASSYFAGSIVRSAGFMLSSLARVPRLSLHLSPWWQTDAVETLRDASRGEARA